MSVRLVGGGEQDNTVWGRVEIQLLGEWGGVCDSSYWWDDADAKVICHMLGLYIQTYLLTNKLIKNECSFSN